MCGVISPLVSSSVAIVDGMADSVALSVMRCYDWCGTGGGGQPRDGGWRWTGRLAAVLGVLAFWLLLLEFVLLTRFCRLNIGVYWDGGWWLLV
jgi:hypothetical protein